MTEVPPADPKKYPNDQRREVTIRDLTIGAAVNLLPDVDQAMFYPATHRVTIVAPRDFKIAKGERLTSSHEGEFEIVDARDPAARRHVELYGARAKSVPVANAGKFLELYVRRAR